MQESSELSDTSVGVPKLSTKWMDRAPPEDAQVLGGVIGCWEWHMGTTP